MSNLDQYIIVFPQNDRSRLSIVAVEHAIPAVLEEYTLASRHVFHDAQEVVDHAQDLALKNNLALSSRDERIQGLLEKEGDAFLD